MRKWIMLLLVLSLLTAWVLWANTALETNEWNIDSCEVPASFEGFRIAQVADLHNTEHWNDVVTALEEAKPDIIVLTGDLVDSGKTDVGMALQFVREAVQIAPCYYVTGNHEAWMGDWQRLHKGLLEAGVRVLQNEKEILERNGESITIVGISDPSFGGDIAYTLNELAEGYTILLSHRPELFGLYARAGIDLIFAGHAHGGQFRIPFVGGLVAPDQGFFPEYDGGLYETNGSAMLVSRGIGNSIIPLRINNRPEIVIAVIGTGFSGEK